MPFRFPSSLLWKVHGSTAVRWVTHGGLMALLGFLAWRFAVISRSPTPPVQTATTAPTFVAPAPQVNGEQLANRHIFGSVPMAVTAAPVMAASAVHVIGIVSTGATDKSWALLDVNGNQKSFAVGSILPDGERLVGINTDRVTLEKDGNRYSVLLDMRPADMNARFETLNIGGLSGEELTGPGGETLRTFVAPPSPDEALQALRQQLIGQPPPAIQKQPREPIAPASKPPAQP